MLVREDYTSVGATPLFVMGTMNLRRTSKTAIEVSIAQLEICLNVTGIRHYAWPTMSTRSFILVLQIKRQGNMQRA